MPIARSSRVRNWRVDLVRATSSGIGSVLALTLAKWPSNAAEAAWVGLGGLVVGLAAAFAVEYLLHSHRELRRLHDIERELAAEREQRAEERRLWEYQVTVAQRTAAVSEIGAEVFGGAFNEALRTGQFLPLSAIMARIEVQQKARGIDQPLPPFQSHERGGSD